MKWFLLICCLSLALGGCGTTLFTSKVGKEISQTELENFRENVLSSKKSIIKTCGCQTGMMQGLFGERYGIDLPNSYQKAAVEYDNLCKSFPNSNYEENFKLCKLIGLKVNMEYIGIKYAKDQFMEQLPAIIQFFNGL
jgi:hypothetical protein